MRKKKLDFSVWLLLAVAGLSVVSIIFRNNNKLSDKKDAVNYQENNNEEAHNDYTFFKSVDENLTNLRTKIKNEKGVFGLYIKDMQTQESYTINANEVFYAASLYKLPVAAATLTRVQERDISLNDLITYTAYDYSDGTGSINKTSYGSTYTISETIDYLMRQSDNSAQLMLERTVTEKYLEGTFSDLVEEPNSSFYSQNVSTPKEVANVIENMFYTSYLSESSKDFLLNLMYPTIFDDRITPYLEDKLVFYHKIGSWPENWHDCGVVHGENKEVIVCLMSKDTNYDSFLNVAGYTAEFVNSLFNSHNL